MSGPVTLTPDQLDLVTGAETPAQNPGGVAFGRCGPADRWRWLGDVYTSDCAAHDAAVRNALANGSSRFMAHVKALPLLPRAIGSYIGARWSGQGGR